MKCVSQSGMGKSKMHPVGFEPTHLSIAVLETAPLDRSGTNALLPSLECVVVSRLGVVGVSCCVGQRSQGRSQSTHIIRLARHEERSRWSKCGKREYGVIRKHQKVKRKKVDSIKKNRESSASKGNGQHESVSRKAIKKTSKSRVV